MEPEKTFKVGSLCTGVGGLDLGVAEGLKERAVLSWAAETDPAASRLLRHRFPGVVNHGDVRHVDYAQVEPVDLLTMGVPCQPVSLARRSQDGGPHRLGEDDPRWLWPQARRALFELAPPLVFFENVKGLVSAEDGRLWRQILADFRAAGYQVTWGFLGACVIGAPHHRHRIWAWGVRTPFPGEAQHRQLGECGAPPGSGGARLLPTPLARDGAARSEGSGEYWAERERVTGRKQSPPLPVVIEALAAGLWGEYEPVVRTWEAEFGRPAPAHFVTGKKEARQLNPEVPEWMMGYPAGWVTLVPGLTYSDMRRLLGNAVCPPQAAYAVMALSRPEREVPPPAYLPPPKEREPRQEAQKNYGVVYSARLPQIVADELERRAAERKLKPGTVLRELATAALLEEL